MRVRLSWIASSIVALASTARAEPQLATSLRTVLFGDVPSDRCLCAPLTLRNTGDGTIEIQSIVIDGGQGRMGHPGDFVVDLARVVLPLRIAPGPGVTFDVCFQPTAGGERSARVVITHDLKDRTSYTNLIGTGAAPLGDHFDAEGIAFGKVSAAGPGKAMTIGFRNRRCTALTIDALRIEGPQADSFRIDEPAQVPVNVAPGARLAVKVVPLLLLPGPADARLVVSYGGRSSSVPLSATGVVPVVRVTPEAIDFGDVVPGRPTQGPVTLTNVGSEVLTIEHIGLSAVGPPGTFTVTTDPLPFDVPVGRSVVFSITFAPMGIGQFEGEAIIRTSDPNKPLLSLPLRGTGSGPLVAVAPSIIDFGAVACGSVAGVRSVSITNTGTAPAKVGALDLDGPGVNDFRFGGFYVGDLPPGKSWHSSVRYLGLTSGPTMATATVSIEDSAPITITVRGNLVPPQLRAVDGNGDFGDVEQNASARRAFTMAAVHDCAGFRVGRAESDNPHFKADLAAAAIAVEPGDSTKLWVVFSPTTVQPETATMKVYLVGRADPALVVSLSGNGIPAVVRTIHHTPALGDGGCRLSHNRSPDAWPALVSAALLLIRRRRPR